MDISQEKETAQEHSHKVHDEVAADSLSADSRSAPPPPFYKTPVCIALVAALLIILGAGFYVYNEYYKDGGTVAVVNGVRISADEFNESVSLIEQSAVAQGIDLNQGALKEEIQSQALDTLVNNALLITAAQKAGFKASEDDVSTKYDELVAQLGGEEALNAQMSQVGLTEEKLRRNIQERILADQYIETETAIKDLAVSEEEINAYIESLGGSDVELPPNEQLRPQVEAQILSQKQQQMVVDLIERLRKSAVIEMR
jgi:hypothetical protein